jgi:predicted AlkP superfamily phosphohydrolase/phosphomutase
MIFGLDGATFTVLDDLVKRGIMPNLQQFLCEGTRAKLLSTIPPLTPLAWSSLITGCHPGRHGILGFFQYSSATSSVFQLASSRQFTAETIWSIVNRQGRRAATFNFVVHQPAPKIDGWAIPGWVSWRWMKQFSHPNDVIDHLKSTLPGFDVKTLAMDMEEEGKAIAGAPLDDYQSWVGLHIARERMWYGVIQHLMAERPAELVGLVFDGVDKIQHLLWRYLDPTLRPQLPGEDFLQTQDMTLDYFREVDRLLGDTMSRYGDDTTILICSDHGFTGSTEIVYINTWLEKQGYLTWKPEMPCESNGSQRLDATVAFVPEQTKAYAMTTSSNGIYINVKGKRDETGIETADYESFRRELIDALLNRCCHPETGEALVTRVWTREEAFAGPNMENAPDLTLQLRDFGFVSVRRTSTIYALRPDIMGTHHPEGILIARGPGIRKDATISPVHLTDIAPTILYAMDLEIPQELQGRVIQEMYRPEFLLARRPKAENVNRPVETASMPVETAEQDLEILEKMKFLGYLE